MISNDVHATNFNTNMKINAHYYHAAQLKNLKRWNTLSKRDLQSKKNKVLQLAYLIMTLIIRMDDKNSYFMRFLLVCVQIFWMRWFTFDYSHRLHI